MNFNDLEKFNFTLYKQPNFVLIKLAYTDPLTGCYNRNMLEEMRDTLDRQDLIVTIVDVDGLKMINDHHGHHAGDILIQKVANQLKFFSELVFRLGGDEFLLIDRQPHSINLGVIDHISFGCYLKTDQSLSFAMQMADEAMYKMKNQRKEMLKSYVNEGFGIENAQTRNSSE